MKPGDIKLRSDGCYVLQTNNSPWVIKTENIEHFLSLTIRMPWWEHLSYYKQLQDMKKYNTSYDQEDLDEGWIPIKPEDADTMYEVLSELRKQISSITSLSNPWRRPDINAQPEGSIECEWRYGEGKKERTLIIDVQDGKVSGCKFFWNEKGSITISDVGEVDSSSFFSLWLWLHYLDE